MSKMENTFRWNACKSGGDVNPQVDMNKNAIAELDKRVKTTEKSINDMNTLVQQNKTDVDGLTSQLSDVSVKVDANKVLIDELDNPTIKENIEYRHKILPNGKQEYMKYFSVSYTQTESKYDYDFTVIPNEYTMTGIIGTLTYQDTGNIYPLNSLISSSAYTTVRKLGGKYSFKWYVVDTGKTVNISGTIYYTKE